MKFTPLTQEYAISDNDGNIIGIVKIDKTGGEPKITLEMDKVVTFEKSEDLMGFCNSLLDMLS